MNEDQIRDGLKDRILTIVARDTALNYTTVLAFVNKTRPVRRSTLKLLSDYLAQ